MEENKTRQPTMEEQMLKAMSMGMYGQHLQSRCRVLSPAKRTELEEAAIQNLMDSYQIDREKAGEMYKRSKG